MKRKKTDAKTFSELLEMNESQMGEGAAYFVTCEQMEIDPDDGWDLLAEAEELEK